MLSSAVTILLMLFLRLFLIYLCSKIIDRRLTLFPALILEVVLLCDFLAEKSDFFFDLTEVFLKQLTSAVGFRSVMAFKSADCSAFVR